MKDLEAIRKQIDIVDKQIISLLDERLELASQVAITKPVDAPLTDPEREKRIFSSLKKEAKNKILQEHIQSIYEQIISLSKIVRIFSKVPQSPIKKIAVIGVGLIGGSIIKACKVKDASIVISTLKRSEKEKINEYIDITYESLEELVKNNELIILASPIETVIPWAEQIAKVKTASICLVMDTASVKQKIAGEFEKLSNESIEFLGTHPMAGSEKSGFENAKATLFIRHPWVMTVHSKNSAKSLEKISKFIQFLGSRVVSMNAKNHDDAASVVSHLIFLMSVYLFAFAQNLHKEALIIAGSGFESTTRLASGNALMHSHIVKNNEKNILETLGEFIKFVQEYSVTGENSLEFFEENRKLRDEFINSKNSL